MKHFLLCIVCLFCIGSLTAWGAPTDRKVGISYTEPTTNGDGTTLEDLAYTKIYQDVVSDGSAGITTEIEATSLAGGGQITQTFCVDIKDDQRATGIHYRVSALDQSGNESPLTDPVVWPVEGTRTCSDPGQDLTAPAVPSDFRLEQARIQ